MELSWLHEECRFTGFVFFRCPREGEEIATALVDCLSAAENQLRLDPGTLITHVDDPAAFRNRTVPMLRALLEQYSILWAIDNMESLLNSDGACRDVFDRHRQYDHLGKVYSGLADLENEQGHPDDALTAGIDEQVAQLARHILGLIEG